MCCCDEDLIMEHNKAKELNEFLWQKVLNLPKIDLRAPLFLEDNRKHFWCYFHDEVYYSLTRETLFNSLNQKGKLSTDLIRAGSEANRIIYSEDRIMVFRQSNFVSICQ